MDSVFKQEKQFANAVKELVDGKTDDKSTGVQIVIGKRDTRRFLDAAQKLRKIRKLCPDKR